MRTIIGVCLDESGSMEDTREKKAAAISAFNEFLKTQQNTTVDECLMAVARFNVVSRVTDKMAPVAEIKPLDEKTYLPGGGTALHDAIAYVTREIEGGVKDDDRVLIVILTDGEENSSHETTRDQVKALITAKEATGRWTFVYLSADLNAFKAGAAMGVRASNVGQYTNSARGVARSMGAVSANAVAYRSSSMPQAMGMSAGVGLDDDDPSVQGHGAVDPNLQIPTPHGGPVPRAMKPIVPPPAQQPGPTPPPAPPLTMERDMWGKK